MSYILAIDNGSTGVRAILVDKQGNIVTREYERTPAIYPKVGYIENDPNLLWGSLLTVCRRIFQKPNFSPTDIAAIGICTQRATFTLWEKATGIPIMNFISWADIRSNETCSAMNKNKIWRIFKKFAWITSRITRNTMLTATTMYKFLPSHVTVRLKWALDNIDGLRERCKNGEIAYGTLDSWFIYKLTGGKVHATDYSNAATGMLNPFQLKWNSPLMRIFSIPKEILPELKGTSDNFGVTDPSLFNGVKIPIRAAAGDQQAALFGQCCFKPGDVKITQGSGAFVSMNVGKKGKLSKRGLFPLVAWVINQKPTYMLEGHIAAAGTLIDWLGQGIGLSDNPKVLNKLASQCDDSEGVIFIPTPSGIQFPYFSPKTKATILGLSLETQRKHVARAVFEGLALRIVDILEGLEKDIKIQIRSIKADGGVSQSDILLQCISDFANLYVNRAPEPDMTATGVAYLAGLGIDFWKDLEELELIRANQPSKIFQPQIDELKRHERIVRWNKALKVVLSFDKNK
ncbi:MAG: glycerol kinase 5 [Candidatus Hodarchaeota archaeon]